MTGEVGAGRQGGSQRVARRQAAQHHEAGDGDDRDLERQPPPGGVCRRFATLLAGASGGPLDGFTSSRRGALRHGGTLEAVDGAGMNGRCTRRHGRAADHARPFAPRHDA